MTSRLSLLYEISDIARKLVNDVDLEPIMSRDECRRDNLAWLKEAIAKLDALPPDQRFYPHRRKDQRRKIKNA